MHPSGLKKGAYKDEFVSILVICHWFLSTQGTWMIDYGNAMICENLTFGCHMMWEAIGNYIWNEKKQNNDNG